MAARAAPLRVFERHRVDDQAAAGPQRGRRRRRARRHRSRRRRRRPRPAAASPRAPRARCPRRSRGRHAERRGVAADARGALGARLDGDGAQRRIGQHPFDRDRAGAGADVPQQLAAPRRQRRQRDGADLALGDLAVVLEQRVGQARRRARGCARPAPASTSIATVLSASTSPRSKPPARRCAHALARPAQRFQHGQARRRRSRVRRAAARARPAPRRPRSAPGSARRAADAAGCRSSARPCSESSVVSGSAQPRRAAARLKADGARHHDDLLRESTWRASSRPTP